MVIEVPAAVNNVDITTLVGLTIVVVVYEY
jgi:hypothetical protein